ncbi:MAG TPA: hypothetical protein VLN45_08295 [Ignavibacteriaceae bacterium]|nr:hypothetical protein [Ignavibacteriaceae bacterium]
MKHIIYFFLVIIFFLAIQCSNEIPNVNDPINLELGKISLKIDKTNAPDNVYLVEAFLTREGYDTLYGALNIVTSTSADILFDEVDAGEWHLRVDAKDSSGVVVYTGETEVNVQAEVLTNVNLVLVPTGLGTGSIYIYVTWGQNQSSWIDYPGNPVLTSQNSYYDNYGVSQPAMIRDGNLFKMWYLGDGGSAKGYVLYAESEDGIDWTHPHSGPVLFPGSQSNWDSWAVHPGSVIKEDGIYKMYYTGWANTYGHWQVGLATSTDGINWVKNPSPVLTGNSNNEYQVVATSVIKIENTYYMYYNAGHYQQSWTINLATSVDGINWTKHSGNPILTATQTWEGNGVHSPSVIENDNNYLMVYGGMDNLGLGMATSTDGINWNSPTDPFFTKENTSNNWGANDIAYPNFIRDSNNKLRIYYTGWAYYSAPAKIGFMKNM